MARPKRKYPYKQYNARVAILVADTFDLIAKKRGLNCRQALEQAMQLWAMTPVEHLEGVPVLQPTPINKPAPTFTAKQLFR